MSEGNIGCLEVLLASMLGTFLVIGGCDKTDRIEKKLDQLLNRPAVVQPVQLEVRTENVFGNKSPEKYFFVNGQKAYTEINGKPVESYFAEKPE